MLWEHEPHKWVNTDYIARVEYHRSEKQVEQTMVDTFIKPRSYETVHRLIIDLVPGLAIDGQITIDGLEPVRKACEALGIPDPTARQPV
jgi:hypothetical protein